MNWVIIMLKATDICNYFVYFRDDDDITNMKVQKLVFYAYGMYLAKYGEKLFAEPIEAWEYGTVVPELYSELKVYRKEPVKIIGDFDPQTIDGKTSKVLDEVQATFGKYTAMELSDLTHMECSPWETAYNAHYKNIVINDHIIKIYFEELLKISDKDSDQKEVAERLSKDTGLKETMYLFANEENAKKLIKAEQQAKNGNLKQIDWRNVN